MRIQSAFEQAGIFFLDTAQSSSRMRSALDYNRLGIGTVSNSALLAPYAEGAFGGDIDYAMLVKVYGAAPEGQRRYSPAICTGAHKYRVEGNPDPEHVSTSFVERSNLSIRMGNRRMTRLNNAFSKKAENHAHMMAIYFMHYNFVRIHQTLKVTPAMAAGVIPKLWEMADMVKVLEDWEQPVSCR
jgi:hypothetical protein